MNGLVHKFNAKVPWPLRLLLVVGVGLCLKEVVLFLVFDGLAVARKLRGQATICPWPRVASYYFDLLDRSERIRAYRQSASVLDADEDLGLMLISYPSKSFWFKPAPGHDGRGGLADLLAEQDWVAHKNPEFLVRPGDIVIDGGAHVGVFTHKALSLGAAKVIAVEPNRINLECFRRNFEQEIASGRVLLVPMGLWSSETTLALFSGVTTAQDTVIGSFGLGHVEIPLTTIDRLVEKLDLPRVDYIKMDIQGAERQALRGGLKTLRRFRPRLMLDHDRGDDTRVLPEIVRQAHSDYVLGCGPCEPFVEDLSLRVPHVIFFK